MKRTRGIYVITNRESGEQYIGSSCSIARRFKEHRQALRKGTSHHGALQRSWNAYGESAFDFSILMELSEEEDLRTAEQSFLDALRPSLNAHRDAASPRGIMRNAETRKKMGAAASERWASKEGRDRYMSVFQSESYREAGRRNSEKFRQDADAKRRHAEGLRASWTQERRQATARRRGEMNRTPEMRAKVSEAKKRYWQERREQRQLSTER